MNTTIIGTGNMGRSIGQLLVANGNSVTIVGHHLEAAEKLAKELNAKAKKGATIKTGELESVELGDVVVLALWYGVNLEVAKKLGSRLKGKIVIDIANPLNATYDGMAVEPTTSSAEELAKVVPESTKVIKAFNTTFGSTLALGQVGGIPLDVFIAGDDESAKSTVSRLVSDGGLVPVDTGPLQRARQLENLGFLGITLQMKHNLGFTTGWKLTRNN
jgi:8-hydroxy-5-deazaflavin:NADPH oxidoreductase